jgi:hypothetical protein
LFFSFLFVLGRQGLESHLAIVALSNQLKPVFFGRIELIRSNVRVNFGEHSLSLLLSAQVVD